MRFHVTIGAAMVLTAAIHGEAVAADPETCRTVRMSDPGWTDITSTNALASVVLEGLGYRPKIEVLGVPVGYHALKNKDLDVFLGNWMPAQQKFRDELDASNAAEVLAKNLEGAKFTLAVPSYVAQAGVSDISDLAEHADKFDQTIFGIEPGAPANTNIQRMIDSGDFGLSGWKISESSEQAMLSQVERAERSQDWIVFLGWAPHPMNTHHDLTYLSGADEYFGPNYGGAEVYTLARAGYSDECPNAADFFSNLAFTVEMENAMMDKILNENVEPEAAAREWLKANPGVLESWLEGVETIEGEPGLPAVRTHLGL